MDVVSTPWGIFGNILMMKGIYMRVNSEINFSKWKIGEFNTYSMYVVPRLDL